MNTMEIFAQRLKNARLMRGLSMEGLSQKMENCVSKMSISKYENCSAEPNSSVVISLANALDLPVDYFFRPFNLQIESIKFRKRSSRLSKKQENIIKESIADLIERYINIEEICNASLEFHSPFSDEISDYSQVKDCAVKLRQEWNLGNDGIVNVINLLEEHGIKVMEIEAPSSFDGLSSMVNDIYPVVILNKTFNSERKRFTALHELGHLIFKFSPSVNDKMEESLCNCFANEMLILESVFIDFVGIKRHDISYQELRQIQLQYGISCDALMFKAKSANIISEERYQMYFKKKNRIPDLKSNLEKSLYPSEESTRFISLVYKALSSEFITISKAAALLHQSVSKVREDLALV